MTEFCQGGELFERIIRDGNLIEEEAATLLIKIISAINHLHQNNICHRDLKPENILFENRGQNAEIKIIDFGLAKCFQEEEKMKTKIGTPYYVSPEVIEGNYDE